VARTALYLLLASLAWPTLAAAQGTPIIPVPATPQPDDEGEEELEEGEEDESSGEGVPIDEGLELPPRLPEPPEYRLRAGAGVALPTAGDTRPLARITQDFEVQPLPATPFYFGVGGAEVLGGAFVIGTVGANIGLAAWVASEPNLRFQGAIHLHLGASFGGGFVSFDAAGEVDLRLLTGDDLLELHLRGGFFTLQSITYIDITAGLGLAF
jgi:hypothetical protein